MADAIPNGNVAPQLAPASAPATGQPTLQTAPSTGGIDPAEFARYKRSHEQYEGARPLIDAATKNGWKDPNDFEAWGKVRNDAAKRGFKADHFTGFLGDGPTREPSDPETFTKADVAKMIGEENAKMRREDAKRSTGERFMSETGKLSLDKVKSALGDDVPDAYVNIAAKAVMTEYYSQCQAYPEGHPLAGELSPAGEQALATALNLAVKTWGEIKTANESFFAGKVGKAALKPANQTAGGPANSGKADKPISGPEARRTRLETLAAAHMAKKG